MPLQQNECAKARKITKIKTLHPAMKMVNGKKKKVICGELGRLVY